ncbi:hypothetical protein CN681_18645 [Bacillus toyonensis]|uniref:Uncharacterized protein n=1 Tax=Bacillus cereus TaxID=1396 RepID=A0A2B3TZM0_BACCE|nr:MULTISPECIES: hypothetical protein [Bacillus cereus group]PED62550.1 hypothetical protein CON89_03480 [Bacillus toyonensis]PEK07815.1 hypothetical protein CN681_18645 [Bacillus toyonensis]PEM97280.1 hypothetical protein CN629_03110 [Bacillus toyonensis]PEN35285.1 hypothetical protein CN541_23155 [Bacillus toyonensis]PFU40065.1 hypothetical protein COK86_19920 [Bacillus cereus]
MKTAKQRILEAREIQRSLSGEVLGMVSLFREQKASVNKDRMLSTEGKRHREQMLKDKFEVYAISAIDKKHKEYKRLLSEASRIAELELLKEAPKVDEQSQKLFNAELAQLRGNIMFGMTPERSLKSLIELVEKASAHPNLAAQIQGEYLTLGNDILQRAGKVEAAAKLRHELLNNHNKLNRATKFEGYEEANAALAAIADMEKGQFAQEAKFSRAFEEISGTHRLMQYANRADDYINDHQSKILQVQMQNKDMQGTLITE